MKYSRSDALKWVKENFRGYSVTTTTPLLPDMEIDFPAIKSNTEKYMALPGVRGLYVGSLYQEFWTQTLDERKAVTAATLEACNGRMPVIVNITHTSIKDSIDLAKHAQSCGADLIMCWPPYYGPRSDDGVLAFYKRLADAVDIGIATYTTTLHELGFYIRPELMARIAEIDTVVAAKEASLSLDKYSAMALAVGDMIQVSAPLEEYYFFGKTAFPHLTPNFIIGSSRPLYMQTQEKPNCANFFDAIEQGDIPTAAASLNKILRVSNELHSRYLAKGVHHLTLMKYISTLFGFAGGPVRPPLTPPTEEEKAHAITVLRDNGLLGDSLPLAAE
jgi:4-hydroxy-tetrahydrodipicolinate synthase